MVNINPSSLDVYCKEHYEHFNPIIEKKLRDLKKIDSNIYDFLKIKQVDILTGTPKVLRAIINDFYTQIKRNTITRAVNVELKKIYDYKNDFSLKEGSFGAYDLAEKLNIEVCPYCNRQYTFTIRKAASKTRPEFDHFFPKSIFPFLALSFYNLIPSCHICNTRKSSVNTFKEIMFNPYDSDSKFPKFKLSDISTIEDIISTKNSDLTIAFDYSLFNDVEKSSAKFSVEKLALDELYKKHTALAKELVQKAYIYSDSMVSDLNSQFPELFSSKDEVKQLVFGSYFVSPNEVGKRPLSKLYRDILIDLNVI